MIEKIGALFWATLLTIPVVIFLQGVIESLPIPFYAICFGIVMIWIWGLLAIMVMYKVMTGD